MQAIYSNTDIVSSMRESFLCTSLDDTTPLNINLFRDKMCIYMIENLTDHMIYIGKTVNLLNRANHYIWKIRNFNESEQDEFKLRTINKVMIQEGIHNFRMFPIDTAETRDELAQLERKYILQYRSYKPSVGYNDVIPCGFNTNYRAPADMGHPHTIATKMKKSKLVACVNIHSKTFFIAVGMKIFGDLLGTTKDYVKTCAKRGGECKGFYVIYLNDTDRIAIKDEKANKLALFVKHRDNKIALYGKPMHYVFNGHDTYLSVVSMIEDILDDFSVESIEKLGYQCYFLTYNENPDNPLPYDVQDISEAFNYISLMENSSLPLE